MRLQHSGAAWLRAGIALQLVAAGLLSELHVGISQTGPALQGTTTRTQYTNSRKIFRVKFPSSSDWAGAPFQIQDQKLEGEYALDLVAFYVKDFGEILITGVRDLPESMLEFMEQVNCRDALKRMAVAEIANCRPETQLRRG
jgi:hypothetical protein